LRKLSHLIKDDKGAVLIVEASIVFPVVLFVLCFLLMVGNAYFQKSRVESIVTQETYRGAAYFAEPLLEAVETGGVPNGLEKGKDSRAKPYRYVNFGTQDMSTIKANIENRVGKMGTGLFSGMTVRNSSVRSVKKSWLVYSTVETNVTYEIAVPIKLLGMNDFLKIPMASHTEIAVSDTPEFIRNLDTVGYYMEISGAAETLEKFVKEIKGVFDTIKKDG
jgi:hypothetical protein